jgi:hypothetical protein
LEKKQKKKKKKRENWKKKMQKYKIKNKITIDYYNSDLGVRCGEQDSPTPFRF